MFDFDTRDLMRKGVHHNALDDTLHQVALIAAAIAKGRPPAPAKPAYAGIFE